VTEKAGSYRVLHEKLELVALNAAKQSMQDIRDFENMHGHRTRVCVVAMVLRGQNRQDTVLAGGLELGE